MSFNMSLPVAWAGPEDAEIVNGQVSIQQSGYNTVITASDGSIINYSSFDILQPEIVEFIQPGSSASVLNRILSANPTNINGTLLANGRVFFVNPAGVYIGAGARINVSQLVASGLDISNTDFINGRYNFAGGDGSVINSGDILAEAVYLIGKQVANSGNISCPDGYVVMASGDRVFLGEPGSDIVLEINSTPLPEETTLTDLEPAVLNEGTVDAAGGTIVLAAAGDIYSQAISNVGLLSVSVETDDAGQITLIAPDSQITNAGTIEASGDTGGSVTIDGGDVVLTADSVIQADAVEDGVAGEVLIYADTLALDGVVTAAGIDGYILFDPDILDIDQTAADAIEVSLDSTQTVDVSANVTINLDGEIDSSSQTNDHTLNFKDEDDDDDLTINLSKSITLGDNQTLTGDGTTVNILSEDASIQNGIDVSATDATITVSDGTYTEDLTIDKSVTLEGAQAGNAVSGRTSGDADESTIVGEHAITGSTVTIDGFTISDPDLGSGNVLINLDSSGAAIDDVTLTNNFVELGSGDIGIDFGGNSSTNQAITNVTIEDSVFSGPGDKISNPIRIGGWFGSDYDVEVDNITFQRNIVDSGSIPIQLQDENLDNITITQNTFTNTDGTVYVWGNDASPMGILSNFEYSENSVDSTNTYGVGIDVFDAFSDGNFDDTIAIINNSFDGVTGNYGFNAVSILSSAFTGTIDASGNWYGTNTEAGVTGEVSANVDYTPWLDSGTDTDLVTPGFQGDFSTLHVSAASPQSGVLGRIDEAIGLVTIGGKINAMAGTYNETVNVNKDLAGIYFQGTSEIGDTITLNESLNIYTENDGDLTLNTILDGGTHSLLVDTGNGTLNLDENVTANSGITLDGGIINVGNDAGDKITSDGTVSITAAAAVTIDAAIDPSTVAVTSNSDLAINNSITADDLITVDAGLVGGIGNVTLNSTGSLETTAVGSDIQIAAGATTGDISLAGDVIAIDEVTMTALGGSILDTGSGMIASDSAILSAKTGIGSAVNSVNTSVSSLTADAGAGIYINETDELTSANLHSTAGDIDLTAGGTISSSILTADAGNVDAETTADDIDNTMVNASGTATLDATGSINNASVTAGPTATLLAGVDISEFNVSADSINMTATTGMIADTDGLTDITGTNAILDADTSIGSDTNPINTEIASLMAVAAEDIYIHETDALELIEIDTSDGDINIKAGDQMTATDVEAGGTGDVVLTTTGTGDVIVDEIKALNDMITIDSAGMISEVAETEPAIDLTAYELDLDAESGIYGSSPIETSAEIIAAETDAGDINIDNTNGSTTTVSLEVTTGIGNILFSQDGDGSLVVTSAATADGSIGIDVDNATLTAQTVTAGGSDIDDNVKLTTTTDGDVIVDNVTAVDNMITIVSEGAISEVVEAEPGMDLTAATLSLTADTGISGQSPIETSATDITAITDAGNIDIDNTNSSATKASLAVAAGAGDILFSQAGGGNLEVTSASTANGNIDIDATADVTLGSLTAIDDQITISSGGVINDAQSDTVTDLTADTLDLTADKGIGTGLYGIETSANTIIARTIDPAAPMADIVIDNHNVNPTSLTASTVGTDSWILFDQTGGGELTLTDVSTVDGPIAISADSGNITAASVNAGGNYAVMLTTTTSGNVVVDSVASADNTIVINSAGSIEENPDDDVDLTAVELDLNAADGIGVAGAIETSATLINANTTDGDIDIDNVNSNPVTAGSLTTGSGNILFSQSGGGSLEVTTASTADGSIGIDVTGTDADLKVGNITAGGSGNVDLTATEGEITQDSGTITANGGSLAMTQRDALDIKNFTFANQINTDISLQSYDGSVTAVDLANGGKDENAADKWKSIAATAEDNIVFQGSGDIKIGGDLTSTSGGVSIISDNGGIYDAGSYNYTMTSGTVLDNVSIYGYSDGTAGVDLPAGSGKAAIILQSEKDLNLGQNCILTATGSYDPTSDERQDVIFELDGEPIDIAIYLSSFNADSGTGSNVEVGSSRISINNSPGEGTLVIDAYDTVTFTDTFENSLKLGGASDIKRLEATSRITADLQSAINFGTLPHADNPAGIADGEFVLSGGVYVLRGPATLLAKASILALTGPVPLVPPVPLEAEDRGEVEEDNRDTLMQWLVDELGEGNVQTYLARAYPPSLNTDLRPYKAAARLRNFATIIKDTEGDQIAALTQVVNEFIETPDPPSEEQMALIVSALTDKADTGTHYALAAQWIDSLVEYVGVLNTEIGWTSEKSVAFVMKKYGSQLTEGDDMRAAMFVQIYMEESFGG
jgi:filamentous hemagglutinin family protein